MLEKLIHYFVYKTKGYITKTQLVKFIYLADLYSVKWTGKQLTELHWYYYNYGPWQDDIDTTLNQMEGKEIIQESQGEVILIKPYSTPDNLKELGLPTGLELMLDNIRREWAGITTEKLDSLLEYVYNTQPMLDVKNTHKPEEKFPLNLQREREKLLNELG